jgi:hypothetical protein
MAQGGSRGAQNLISAVVPWLNDLQSDDYLSFTAGGCLCSICSTSWPTFAQLARHCWARHRLFPSISQRIAALYLFPDLPANFTCLSRRDPDLSIRDFHSAKAQCRVPALHFPFILAALAPRHTDLIGASPIPRQVIVMNLPTGYPVQVETSDGDVLLAFLDGPDQPAEGVLDAFRRAAAEIAQGNVAVAKFINICPAAVSDDALHKLRRQFPAVILKTRVTEDWSMRACDVTISVMLPRWQAGVGGLVAELENIGRTGDVRLCTQCGKFFPVCDRGDCQGASEHCPFADEYTAVNVYTRPFAPGNTKASL